MDAERACCAPSRPAHEPQGSPQQPASPSPARGHHDVEQAKIPTHQFFMGDAHGDGIAADREGPPALRSVSAFEIDSTTVTVENFARFVVDTSYITEAEQFGYSAVFEPFFKGETRHIVGRSEAAPWWIGVRGADWLHPEGPTSDVTGREDHPAVHVSWNDAIAYCVWADRRLPTETQWEAASRGGLDRKRFPWGDEILLDGQWQCNIWQGRFPRENLAEDGWLGTAPVRSYNPNAFGLWQTVGNVWEWCADPWNPSAMPEDFRVLKGGSFLCHDSYCNRYRNSARTSNTADSTSSNIGFRTVSP